jgi:hypothetical protein
MDGGDGDGGWLVSLLIDDGTMVHGTYMVLSVVVVVVVVEVSSNSAIVSCKCKCT